MTQTRTANRRFGLSKSKITAFEQCPKKLWLATHRPELAEQDEGAEARFANGNAVGEIACALHPGGVMVDPPSLSEAIAKTSSLISGGHPGSIFEATFEHDGVLVRVDVLEKLEVGGWAAAEVKSSGKVKDYHRGDLATQVWVMREAGIELKRAAIRHIDTGFVLTREGDYAGLFTDADLLAELEGTIATRPALVTHHEFLSCDGTDPRRACAEALVEHIPVGVTIIAYNAAFERSVLRELAASFPDLAPRLESMAEATVDLLPVARNHWYHRDQCGSWSIKAVLPTIAADLDYGALEVKDGDDAQAAWFEAADPACDPLRREALEEALRAYCARDTWAMVAVARALAGG